MYYYLMHILFSCHKILLFLLLISPSAFALSVLYFRNTSPKCCNWCFTVTGPETIFERVPPLMRSYWFLVPFPQFVFVFQNTPPAHTLFYFTSPCINVAGEARPLSVVHEEWGSIRTHFASNLQDDADKWHRSHSMCWCRRGCGAIACKFEAS